MSIENTNQQIPETKTEAAAPVTTPTQAQVESKPPTDSGPNFGNMSAKDLRVYAESMLELKRAANLEAKQYREQLEARTIEFENFKKDISVKETHSQFLAKTTEAGLNAKVAKAIVASMKDLSIENMDAKVAEVLKEYAELVSVAAPEVHKPQVPAPHAPVSGQTPLSEMGRDELMRASVERTNSQRK